MATFTENNSKLRKFLSKAFTRLMLGLSVSFVFLPIEKGLGDTPRMYSGSSILSISYEECKSRSSKAAAVVLSKVKTPSEKSGSFQIFGTTAATVAVIYCIERAGGTASIIATSAYWRQEHSEALSVYQRLTNFMTNGL